MNDLFFSGERGKGGSVQSIHHLPLPSSYRIVWRLSAAYFGTGTCLDTRSQKKGKYLEIFLQPFLVR